MTGSVSMTGSESRMNDMAPLNRGLKHGGRHFEKCLKLLMMNDMAPLNRGLKHNTCLRFPPTRYRLDERYGPAE